MTDELERLQQQWARQSDEEKFEMTVAEIRATANVFQSRIAIRNAIEYIAAAFGTLAFAGVGLVMPFTIIKVGALLSAAGMLVTAWNLHQRGRAASRLERESAASSWLEFHRAELTRQRDALHSVWSWYLGPLIPGAVTMIVGFAVTLGVGAASIAAVFGLGVFCLVGWANARAARTLQIELDRLDDLG